MSSDTRTLVVVLDAGDLGPRRPVGLLRRRPGLRPVVSFEYVRSWLEATDRFPLEPSLPLVPGEQFTAGGGLPGIFADASPDRWGRRLIERREAANARREDRLPRQLDDWDFLVGVADATRMGALRLGAGRDGPFLDDQPGIVPPLTRLRTLEFAAQRLDDPDGAPLDDPDVALLIAPGSSLGGARPKANYLDPDGTLWIAKFPSRQDRWDVGAWEHLVAQLAQAAGVTVAESRALRLSTMGTTYATRRFDRDGDRRRLFVSAMTMIGKADGDEASYLELAQAIADFVEPRAVEADLAQMFRRLVFNVMVGNRDDHLRNHGFLRTLGGWRLAPAFDVNPAPELGEHALAIDDRSHGPSLELAAATRSFYRLSADEATETVRQVEGALAGWEARSRAGALPLAEIELMRASIGAASHREASAAD
jgi:serine/threonine-protein kinase HipA